MSKPASKPPSRRQEALNAIKVGDLVYGVGAGGQEKLFLVYEANEDSFLARHVTSQSKIKFYRNGRTRLVPGGGRCTIVSTAPLPQKDRDVAIGLDRKMRTGKEYPDFVLSKDEVQLLLTFAEYFKARPLPDE